MKWFSDRRAWSLIGLLALSAFVGPMGHAQSSLPVVPNGFGFGMSTRAAYGGSISPTIYRVTNLNDSGTGSLRAALEASGPRVVIFEISGTIALVTHISITNPYLTVAGQTAPAPGILVRDQAITINTHDVLMQHFRVRAGSTINTQDCMSSIEVGDLDASNPAQNVVLDHMSISWGQHLTVGVFNTNFRGTPSNVAVWRSIISEGMSPTAQPGTACTPDANVGEDYLGMVVYIGTTYVSVIQTLFAHNGDRNPYAVEDTLTYDANNVVYDPFTTSVSFAAPHYSATITASIIGNYFKYGPETYVATSTYGGGSAMNSRYLPTGSRIYHTDTTLIGPFTGAWSSPDGIDPTVGTPPVTVPGYTPLTSTATYASVLANAGAWPANREPVDTRIVSEVQNATGDYVGSFPTYPTLAVNGRSLTTPPNPNTVTGSGYTNLEVWLHGYATVVETGTLAAPPARPGAPLLVYDLGRLLRRYQLQSGSL